MIIRLGRVLYWTAAALAVLVIILGTALALSSPGNPTEALIVIAGTAGALFFFGAAARYIISGESVTADFPGRAGPEYGVGQLESAVRFLPGRNP